MKRLVLIALIISVTAGVVFAQVDLPGGAWSSPQSTATSGRIRSIADDFIRADAYTNVKFDNFFSMISYQSNSALNLGYATKAGDLYIGAFYRGTFLANIPNIDYTEAKITWLGSPDTNKKIYTTLPNLGANSPDNTISVLIGVADMGFRLSLYTNKKMFSDNDFYVTGLGEYYSYETESGRLTPQLAWSMTKNLTENGVKPYLSVDMDFNKTYSRTVYYVGTVSGDTYLGSNNDSQIDTIIRAGLGGYTLLNKNGFRFSADLDYALTLRSWDNEYNYSDGSSTKIKTGFKGTITDPSNPTAFSERNYSSHLITPSVSGQWGGGPLAFRFKFNLPVTITSDARTAMAPDGGANDGSLVKSGLDYTDTIFRIAPDVRLAAQWKIIPKLALNLGGRIQLGSIGSTTTDGKYYFNNNEVDNSSYKTTTPSFPTGITNTLATGVTFNITDNLTFEAASGASNGNIDVFGTTSSNSLLYFTNLLVSLRF